MDNFVVYNIMNKKNFLIIIWLIIFPLNIYSQDKYKLVFKTNNELKYNILFMPIISSTDSDILKFLKGNITKDITMIVSYNKLNVTSLNVSYDLSIKDKSCCNPFTFISWFLPLNSKVENIINHSGKLQENIQYQMSVSCIFGFNIFKIQPDINSKKNEPIVLPIYFAENEIAINEKWINTFYFNKSESIDYFNIEYTLKYVNNNIAGIEGRALDDIYIEATFDIERGCIISLKIFNQKQDIKKLVKSFELLN